MSYNTAYFKERSLMEPKHALFIWAWTDYFKPKKVLDWGCGAGLFVKAFMADGVEAWGWDPNLGLTGLFRPELKATPPLTADWDLIICIDVLEHLTEDEARATLLEIRKRACKNVLFSICFEGDPNFPLDKTHVTCKSKEWWMNLITESGFIEVRPAPENFPYHNQHLICEVAKC